MIKGSTIATRMIEKSLDEETKMEIDLLLKEAKTYSYEKPDFKDEIKTLINNLSEDQILTLKGYTGIFFKKINAILRNNWNYEEHGKKTKDEEQHFRKDISEIDKIIEEFPQNKNAFITYRGTSINAFKKYCISNIEDLIYLKDKYIYEEGYTSTSLDEKKSYYNKVINGTINNIEIRYIIPPYSNDGIPLTSDSLSYSPNQMEYLLGKNSLSKVVDIKIENENAVITVVLIPKKIWNSTKSSEKGYIK